MDTTGSNSKFQKITKNAPLKSFSGILADTRSSDFKNANKQLTKTEMIAFHSYFMPRFHVGYKDEKGYGGGVERSFYKTLGDSIKETDESRGAYFWKPNKDQNYYSPRLDRRDDNILLAVGYGLGYSIYYSENKDIQSQCLNVKFTRSFYKQILGRRINFHDFAFYDIELYDRLIKFRNSTDEELRIYDISFLHSFSAEESPKGVGARTDVALKNNGENILVTRENIDEFIELMVYKKMIEPYQEMAEIVRKGINLFFNRTLEYPIDNLFEHWTAEDLMLLLGGEEKFNKDIFVDLVKAAIERCGAYYKIFKEKIGPNFLWCIDQLSNEELFKLWFFWTSLPVLMPSFAINNRLVLNLSQTHQLKPNEQKSEDAKFLNASTCSYHLDVRQYSTKEIMLKQILISIECVDFGNY